MRMIMTRMIEAECTIYNISTVYEAARTHVVGVRVYYIRQMVRRMQNAGTSEEQYGYRSFTCFGSAICSDICFGACPIGLLIVDC